MTKRKRVPDHFRSKKAVYVPGKKPVKKSSDMFARGGAVAGAVASSSGAARVVSGATSMWNTIPAAYVSAVEDSVAVAILEDMLTAAGMGGAVVAGGVAAAAGLGYLAGMAIDSVFTQTNTPVQNLLVMSGGYAGKFAMSAQKSSKGLRDKFQKYGAVAIEENYGSVADPDILYLGQSTYNIDVIVNVIAVALLRKLFRVGCKVDVKTFYEELPLIGVNPDSGPYGFKILYRTRDSDGTYFDYLHNIPNDSSLNTLATRTENGFRLIDSLRQAMVEENPKVLVKVLLFLTDEPAGTQSASNKLVYQMDLNTEVLEITMSSHMVIQNRTRSASAGSNEITVVDAQPLKGPVYEFSTGVPKIKGEGPYLLGVCRPQGLILVRGAELGGTDIVSYREPPVKNTFQNVVKSGYVRLGPGAMKSMVCASTCKGFFGNVLYKLRYNNDSGVVSRSYGKSQMVCLEEELNSGSANNMTISYECQHISGAQLTTTLSPNMQPGFASSEQSNLPA